MRRGVMDRVGREGSLGCDGQGEERDEAGCDGQGEERRESGV